MSRSAMWFVPLGCSEKTSSLNLAGQLRSAFGRIRACAKGAVARYQAKESYPAGHQGHLCTAITPKVANHAAISIQRIMAVMLSANVSRKGFGMARCKLAIVA